MSEDPAINPSDEVLEFSCRETDTGRAGNINIRDDGLRLTLTSFEKLAPLSFKMDDLPPVPERLPDYQQGSGLSNSEVDELCKIVVSQAKQSSMGISSERARQVLGELKRIPLRDRMTLAIRKLETRFGKRLVPPSILEDSHVAIQFRNKTAHGKIAVDENSFEVFARAVFAVELVCLLSMVSGLDIDVGKLQESWRMDRHPLFEYLSMNTGNQSPRQ